MVRTAVTMSYYTAEQWDQLEEPLGQNDDDVFDDDDEEVHALNLEELGALLAASQLNSRLAQGRETVKHAEAAWKPMPKMSDCVST